MAALGVVPVIQKEAWAQCENPNCQKWRRLPAGAAINEDEPWYCYLNPDAAKNTCSASEVEYDETTEMVIEGTEDPEEAARNRAIMAQLEASIAAAAAAAKASRGRGRGRGGRGQGRGRGRPPAGGAGARSGGRSFGAAPLSFFDFGSGGPKRGRSVQFADVSDEYEELDSDVEPISDTQITRRHAAKHLQRLLVNQGQWEGARGGGGAAAAALPAVLPAEAWEALSHADHEAADLACSAADVCSSLRYFEAPGGAAAAAAAAGGVAEEAGLLSRATTMLAAASGLVENSDALTKVEREGLGLEGGVALPPVAPAAAPAQAADGLPPAPMHITMPASSPMPGAAPIVHQGRGVLQYPVLPPQQAAIPVAWPGAGAPGMPGAAMHYGSPGAR